MTQLASKSVQRMVWAMDPFEEKSNTRSHVISTLQELSSRGVYIEPVYVLSPDEYDVDVEFNAPWLKQIRPTTEKVVEHYLKSLKIDGLASPKIIIEKRPSLTRAVRALVAYAEKSKADTILVGTHAKTGISRFFLGSFAETLLLHSKVPILIVGPDPENSYQGKKFDRILFSTDFGPSSYSAFKKLLVLARTRHAKITLFHCLSHAIEPFVQSGVFLLGGGHLSFPDYLTKNEQRKKQAALRYLAAAKKYGVEIEVVFNPGRGGTVQAIVDQAEREKSTLIAMAAESGAVSAALIGSVTRQVVRSAPCPVWVLRTS